MLVFLLLYLPSRKHAYIILTPFDPTFIVKLGFAGIYIIFLIFAQNIDCGYSLEPLAEVGLTSTHNLFLSRIIKKNIRDVSIYLNRRVFVMPLLSSASSSIFLSSLIPALLPRFGKPTILTCMCLSLPGRTSLRKQAYLKIVKLLPHKKEYFQIKILVYFMFLLKIQIVGTR